jgi:hypothetical protein
VRKTARRALTTHGKDGVKGRKSTMKAKKFFKRILKKPLTTNDNHDIINTESEERKFQAINRAVTITKEKKGN